MIRVGTTRRKVLLSVVDQGVVSIANFLLVTTLARLLPVDEFGLVSLLLFVGVLVNNVHIALITQPHNVLAAKLSGEEYLAYTQGAFALLLVACTGGAVVAFVIYVSAEFGAFDISNAEVILAFVLVYLQAKLAQDFFRRVLFTTGEVQTIVVADLIAYGGTIALLAVAYGLNITAPPTLFLLFALPFVISIGFLVGRGGGRWRFSWERMLHTIRTSRAFATWAFLSTATAWLGTRVYPVLLGLISSMESVAVYAVMMNVINAINPLFLALTNVLTTIWAKVESPQSRLRKTRRLAVFISPVALGATATLVFFPREVLTLLYGDRYAVHHELLQLTAAAIIFIALANILQLHLRSSERVKPIFEAFSLSTLLSLSAGAYLIHRYDLHGAITAFFLSWIVADLALSWRVFGSRGTCRA